MKNTIRLSFKPDISVIADECEKLEAVITEAGAEPSAAMKVRCIAHELLVNVVRHGKPSAEPEDITLDIEIYKDRIELLFIDCGIEWKPDQRLLCRPFHYTSDDELYAPSGKGLRLIGAMCRSYRMFRYKGRNHTAISVGLE